MVSSERFATAKQHDATVEIWVQNLLAQDGLQHVGMLTQFYFKFVPPCDALSRKCGAGMQQC